MNQYQEPPDTVRSKYAEYGDELPHEEPKMQNWYVADRREEVIEQFGRKINQDLDGNRKLPWKEVSKVKGGSGELQQNKI